MVVEKNSTSNVYREFLPRYGERANRARVERCRSGNRDTADLWDRANRWHDPSHIPAHWKFNDRPRPADHDCGAVGDLHPASNRTGTFFVV